MFKLHAVQAQFGDSLVLEFGTDASPRYVLIDGGPPDNFALSLDDALQEIVTTKKLDLVVLSHIDNDHVVGLLDLFAAVEEDKANGVAERVKMKALWHNSFQRSIDPNGTIIQRMQSLMTASISASVAMPLSANAFFGLSEGNRLRILAKKLKVPVNKGFPDDLIIVDTAPAPIKLGKLTLTVVGPDQANLDALRAEWLAWLAKTEHDMSMDPATLANSDKSIPNLSSIVLLAECDGRSILLTGDARGDHIISGLDSAGKLTNGKLHVDVFKAAHHGSNRNVNKTFFKNITADTYVISADGTYDNPDLDTLQWIVEAAKAANRKIDIVVTNATDSTKALKQTHKPADFGYKLIVKPKTKKSIAIELA